LSKNHTANPEDISCFGKRRRDACIVSVPLSFAPLLFRAEKQSAGLIFQYPVIILESQFF
jgi:hypothetical protein